MLFGGNTFYKWVNLGVFLQAKVDVQAVRDTELIMVNVTDPDPERARDIANEMALVFKEQVVEIMQIENVSVIDEAVTPFGPVSPRIDLNVAAAFVVGLMGATGLAFLLEYLDRTIKDPEEAQRLLGVPVIGVIPTVYGDRLFTWSNPRSPAAEAFRSLRTNLQYSAFSWSKIQPSEDLGPLKDNFHYSSMEGPVKSIVVAGANPDCGKSTVTANLAVTLARGGSSVLVVDGDLRRPYLHQFFKVEREPGLSTLIVKNELALEVAVQESEIENLSVLASGPVPPYPAEMLSSKRMKKLSEQLAQKFDYVVYDSPPIMAVTDAALLSRLANGTIVVFDYGKVRREEAVVTLEHFKKVQANLIGLVINNMPHSRSYYNGYQYYYGENDKHQARRGHRKTSKKW